MDPASDDCFRDCLCVVCRQSGHVVEGCPDLTSPPDTEYRRPSPPFSPFQTTEGSIQALCQRCNQFDALNRIASHRPLVWEDLDEDYAWRATRKTSQIPPLGQIGSLRLLSTCPLCRLIFDASYLTDEEMKNGYLRELLVVVPGWTIHRLERGLYWRGYGKGKGPYAKCLYTSVTDGIYEPTLLVEGAVEAIGLIDVGESQPNDGAPALGVRQLDPCKTPTMGLKQIKLINVETRQIVMYPPDNCDYVALSYVWGGVEQPSHKLGEILPTVPATLEDAMVVARNLGKQYLWADSLCIDQEDNVEKAVQIALMSAIFNDAWATIICLSGRSAQSGLPRVGTQQGVVAQLSCEIWGKRLLSVMPMLSQQILWSPWASRAWTFQEGLLSPRCLFFTNHQVYFECNSLQCCESLDDSDSPFHLLSDEQRRAALDDVVQDPDKASIAGPEGVIGRGVLRDPFRPISSAAEAQIDDDDFARYLRLVHSYTMKKMSRDADALDAFSAILTRLTESYYKDGFVQGLPVEDLPRALLWFHHTPPRRRVDFPAWSWAGWEGGVSNTIMYGAKDPDDVVMPPLRIWKARRDDHPELIYNFNPTPHIIRELENPPEEENHSEGEADDEKDSDSTDSWEDDEGSDPSLGYEADCESDGVSKDSHDEDSFEEINFEGDPVFQLAKTMLGETPAALPRISGDELLIEGIVIQLSFTDVPEGYYSETDDEYDGGNFARLGEQLEPQRIRFYGHHVVQLINQQSSDQHKFLLISRERHENFTQKIYNALLLIDQSGDVANKMGVASLRLDSVELLHRLKPERKLFKLR